MHTHIHNTYANIAHRTHDLLHILKHNHTYSMYIDRDTNTSGYTRSRVHVRMHAYRHTNTHTHTHIHTHRGIHGYIHRHTTHGTHLVHYQRSYTEGWVTHCQ